MFSEMRVDIDRSRNGYRPHYGRKSNVRLKRRNYRTDDSHYSRNHPSRAPLKSRSRYHDDADFSSPSLNTRIGSSQLNYHDNHSTSSSRFDRDSYSTLLTDQPALSSESPLTTYSPQTVRDRVIPLYYDDSERIRYPPPPPSSSNYRRDSSPLSSYRNDGNDFYIRDEYRSLTTTPFSHPYNDTYRSSDYNNRSERYTTAPNRNSPSRDYSMPSTSSSPPPPPSYLLRNQYTQPNSSVREVDYRRRDYGRTIVEHSSHSDRDRSRSYWNHDARSTRTIRR